MTTFRPHYRLEVRAPRSADATEATVLTPAAGAPHGEPFRATTRVGDKPTIIVARKSSNQSSTPIPATVALRALGYTVVEDLDATLAECRAYDIVVISHDAWNAADDNTFIQQLQQDGQRVLVDGNDSNASLFYVATTEAANPTGTAIPGARPHFISTFGAGVTSIADADNGLRITAVEGGAIGYGAYSENANAFPWVVVPHVSGGMIVHLQTPRIEQADDNVQAATAINNAIAWLKGNWQPYLDTLRGRRGRIDLKSRKLDVGSLTVRVLDKKAGTSGGNAQRWVSAFFGDAKGKPRGKLLCVIWESLDDGATWSQFFTGRLQRAAVAGKLWIELTIREETEALKMPVFVGEPHSSVTYAGLRAVLPVGIMGSGYGTIKKVAPMTATTATLPGSLLSGKAIAVNLSSASVARDDNLATAALVSAIAPNTVQIKPGTIQLVIVPNFTGRARVRLKHLSGALSGQTGDYRMGAMDVIEMHEAPFNKVKSFVIAPLESTSARNYLALPATGVSCEIHIFVEDAATEERPLLINDVDPATLLEAILDGKFGYLYHPPEVLPSGKIYGDIKRKVAHTGISAHVGKRPPFRGVIQSKDRAIDWIEKYLLKQYHWAIYFDRQGRVNLVDLKLPASLAGIGTITDADVVAGASLEWEHDQAPAITRIDFQRYLDRQLDITQVTTVKRGFRPISRTTTQVAVGAIEIEEHPLLILDIGSSDFEDNAEEIDAHGHRAMDGEQMQGLPRFQYMEGELVKLANEYRRPWAWGGTTITIPCRRTAAVTALSPGSLVLASITALPDPTSHARGSTRLLRVVEITENGPNVAVQAVDLAVNAVASAPTIGDPTLETDNNWFGINSSITLNAAGQPVELQWAATATSVGSAPAEDSPLWTAAGVLESGMTSVVWATGTVTIRNLPPGKRIWLRGRSFPVTHAEPQLPSAWTLAGGDGRVDMTALSAPSGASITNLTNKSLRLSWTNGSADLWVEIWTHDANADDLVDRIAILPPGTTRIDIGGLTASTLYKLSVIHVWGQHRSLASGDSDTTAGTPPTATAVAACTVRKSNTTFVRFRLGFADPGFRYSNYGVALSLIPGDVSLRIEIQRAPDSSGSPGTWADIAEVGPFGRGGGTYTDMLPYSTDIFWYRARHVGDSVEPGAYTTPVSSTPYLLDDRIVRGWEHTAPQYPGIRAEPMTDGKFQTKADDGNGTVISSDVGQTDGVITRILMKGQTGADARDGDPIDFAENFQNVPIALFRGGVSYQPESKWGTAAEVDADDGSANDAPAAVAMHELWTAEGLSVSGVDKIVARLRQDGTPTARSHNFGSNDLDTEGETIALTLVNAPALDNTYSVHYSVIMEVQASNEFGNGATLTIVVAVETRKDGGSWIEGATRQHQVFDPRTGHPLSTTLTLPHEVLAVTVADLDTDDEIRLKLKSISLVGLDATIQNLIVHGFDGTGDPASGVTYTTDSGVKFTSKTPGAQDRVHIDFVAAT